MNKMRRPLLPRNDGRYGACPGLNKRTIKTVVLLIVLAFCSIIMYQCRFTFSEGPGTITKEQVTEIIIQIPIKIDDTTSNIIFDNDKQVSDISMDSEETVSDIPTESKKTVNTVIDDLRFSNITLDDIFIGVVTTKSNHETRLPIILKTWFQKAKQQTWFFSDFDDEQLQMQTNQHMINTKWPKYACRDPCCKVAVEYEHYFNSSKKWFCHFNDDNYVNIPRLLSFLQKRNFRKNWYFGKNLINKPVRMHFKSKDGVDVRFMYITGGAGYCISIGLALKLRPQLSDGRFSWTCSSIRTPKGQTNIEDITMGYIIEIRLQTRLTIIQEFHSHMEQLTLLPADSFEHQISFSYGPQEANKSRNVLNMTLFDDKIDPTRFLSLHCFLFPNVEFCLR